jgi:hypothetical protein
MPYTVEWYQQKNIVLCTTRGNISDADLWEIGQTLTAFLDQGQPPVHVVFDLENMERFPRQLPKIRRILQEFFEHPGLGSITLAGRVNPLARVIAETLSKTFRVEYRGVARDLPAAVNEIQAVMH